MDDFDGFGGSATPSPGNRLFSTVAQTGWLVAAAVILILHWDDGGVCDEDFREKWRWWLLVATVAPGIYVVILAAAAACGVVSDSTYLQLHCISTKSSGTKYSSALDWSLIFKNHYQELLFAERPTHK